MASKFVHLHGHTEYSLLDGLAKVKKLVKKVKDLGMPAVAITDHGGMFGAIEFYKEAVKSGIKPIIGCELYVAKRSHKDKEGKLDTEPYHLTVMAKNHQGYLNLMKLVSVGYLDGYYYKPRVDRELLSQYSEGLIALSGCPAGEFIRSLKDGDLKDAEKVAKDYLEIFGEENYFFELQNHQYDLLLKNSNLDLSVKRELERMGEVQNLTWGAVSDLSKKLGVRVVATNDFHYVEAEDAEAQDAVVCVQTGKFIKDINRLRMIDTPNLYLRSADEMAELFEKMPQALETSVQIAEMIDLEISLGKAHFPIFNIPGNLEPMDYLTKMANEGLAKRFKEVTPELKERLDYELSVIAQKKYATYFLIVADFMNWAKEHEIITNTRGSAAGSLVLYVIGVTDIDPIFYRLPFERFLNPYRPSLPDIDCDMADDRRDEVIKYVMEKFGHDKVAHIVTFGTMMGRAAVRDIGRVLGIPYGEVDRIAKLVPPPHQGFHKPLEEAIKEVPELLNLYDNDQQLKVLLDLAKKVEGTVRHASVHAAGIVISPVTLTEFTPLMREANGDKIVTQYDMFSVGEDGVGLVKMDFLGIRNLSILGHSVKIVKENRGIEVDLTTIPIDDKKTFELLSRGETMGLFQLEGDGMTRYLVELKPTNIFDIMAMIALYRPGPLAIIPEYIARKRDPSKITYFDDRMKEILERSLGLLVYQDDVLLTAITLAGYNWEEVDKFRKAMGKKIPEEMAKQKDHFIHGCVEHGMQESRAHELFKLIEPFAAYGFNKCITGDTLLYDASSGKKMTVESLYKTDHKFELLSLQKDLTLSPQTVSSVQENGVKPVFALITKEGRSIKATDNHPFYTSSGWVELKNLKLGERIATVSGASSKENHNSTENPGIYWDEIVSITPKGEEMTYDLTIPETHNFVANDIIVHNSHAASYSTISYQTAYMKANYSEEFMAAVMTAEYGDIEKIAHAMEECKRMGIVVLPPNVNRSKVGFTIEDLNKLSEDDLKRSIGAVFTGQQKQGIRFGLSAIKNVGILAIESIIKARDKNAFSSLGDLCGRVDNRLVNRRTLEALIKAGALDSFGSRAAQMLTLDQCLELAHAKSKKASSGQVGLFGAESSAEIVVALPEVEEWDLDQMLLFEKELLGFYLHEPKFLAKLNLASKYANKQLGEITEANTGERVLVAALVADARKVITKKSAAEMAFIRLTDTKTTLDAVVFPKTYLDCKVCIEKDKVVLVWAKVETRDESLSLIVDRMLEYNPDTFDPTTINVGVSEAQDVTEKKRYYPKAESTPQPKKEKEIEIHVPKDSGVDVLQQVNKTLREYPGKIKVSILLSNGGNNLKKLDLPFGIKADPSLVSELETLLGKGTIRLT